MNAVSLESLLISPYQIVEFHFKNRWEREQK